MTPETGTIWDFDEQPRTLRNGDTSDDGQIRALNGIAEITNPQTKIMDGPDPYELECVGATYSHTRVELYTNSKLLWTGNYVAAVRSCVLQLISLHMEHGGRGGGGGEGLV